MRTISIMAIIAMFLLLQSPAQAQVSAADRVIARIEADGYTVTEVKRSWLGRIVITATKDTDLREVVLNRTSGEVLRDQRFANENPKNEAPAPPANVPNDQDHSGNGPGHDGPGGPGGPDGSDGEHGGPGDPVGEGGHGGDGDPGGHGGNGGHRGG